MNTAHDRRQPVFPRRRTTSLALASVAVVAPLAVLGTAAPAGAVSTPPETGCPAGIQVDGKTLGYQTLSVAWLETQGPYKLPARLDDPANGGNGDGLVCGLPLPDGAEHLCPGPCDVPILYDFSENDLTPEH